MKFFTTFLAIFTVISSMAIAENFVEDYLDARAAYDAEDYETAFSKWKPIADFGAENYIKSEVMATTQYNIGMMYEKGQGVPQDYEKAIMWYRIAADQDNSHALTSLGILYKYGRGVAKDYNAAADLLHRAVKQGDSISMVHLAAMYRLGEGVPQDYSEAKRLFILSRTPIGYHSVGHFYWSGEGFPQDYKEARKFYLLGAELGDGPSQSMLGAMHKFGHGVLQNLTLAHMWFNIGAANDVEWAREERDSIAKSMAPEDISNAQAMARKCMKSNYKECGY